MQRNDKTLSVPEAAEELGCSEITVYRYVSSGKIPGCFKRFGRIHIPKSSLRHFDKPLPTEGARAS